MASTLAPTPPIPAAPWKRFYAQLAIFAVLAVLAAAACLVLRPGAALTESGVEMQLPDRILGFQGRPEPISEAEKVLLPEDTEIVKKLYTNDTRQTVNLQIVLSGVEHRSIHRPEICLKGQGWTISGQEVVKVPLDSGRSLEVMVLDIWQDKTAPNGATVRLPALYAYFFVSHDAQTPYHRDRIAITNLDLLLHNKSHRWAYVIAMAPVLEGIVPGGMNRDQTLQLLEDFLRKSAPAFLKSERPADGAPAPTP